MNEDLNTFLDEQQAIADAATPGPWSWFGNTDYKNIYLATIDRGRQFVMSFRRWGMNGAAPAFQNNNGWMQRADEFAVMEVDYRADFTSLDHPDATFIAASRQTVPRLIEIARTQQAEIEQLRTDRDRRALAASDSSERLVALRQERDELHIYKEAWNAVIACGECQDRSEVLDHFNKRARAYGLPKAGE